MGGLVQAWRGMLPEKWGGRHIERSCFVSIVIDLMMDAADLGRLDIELEE
jgi:hypothetical protein